MKKVIVKSKHDHSLPKKFSDPLLQEVQEKLEQMYVEMRDELLSDIFSVIGYEDLKKSGGPRIGHKYIKRTGGPGNYRYWYKDPTSGKIFSNDKPINPNKKPQVPHEDHSTTLTVKQHADNINAKLAKVGKKLGISEKALNHKTRDLAKPSKFKYESPKGINPTNLVKSAKFGRASPDVQVKLNTALQSAEVILSEIGLKMKTPIHFYSDEIGNKGSFNAIYFGLLGKNINHEIKLIREHNISNSLMHEIGHAIDFSMASSLDSPRSEDFKSEKNLDLRGKWQELLKTVANSALYQRSASKNRKEYLSNTSEIFARAFEVYTYEKASNLTKQGKLDESFIQDFYPELYGSGEHETVQFHESNDYKIMIKRNETLNDQKKTLMIQRNKTPSIEIDNQIKKVDREQKLLNKRLVDMKERYGSRSVPLPINEEERVAISSKIVNLMDDILKNDKIRKSLEQFGIEVL